MACVGVAAGFEEVDTIVVHDADISTYESSFVARLAQPIVDDRLGFDFVKGFILGSIARFEWTAYSTVVGPLLGR